MFTKLVESYLFTERVSVHQLRMVIKQKYPKVQFVLKQTSFDDFARGAATFLEVKNTREAIEEYGFGLKDALTDIIKQQTDEKIIVRMQDIFFTHEDVDRIKAKFQA